MMMLSANYPFANGLYSYGLKPPDSKPSKSLKFSAIKEFTPQEFDDLFAGFDQYIRYNSCLVTQKLKRELKEDEIGHITNLQTLFAQGLKWFNAQSGLSLTSQEPSRSLGGRIQMSESDARRWIEGSQISTKMFHGRSRASHARILQQGFSPYRTQQGRLGYGTYFTEFGEQALRWVKGDRPCSEGHVLYEVYLNIRKHLYLPNRAFPHFEKLMDGIYQAAFKEYLATQSLDLEYMQQFMALRTRFLHHYLGFDAVTYKGDQETGTVVFDPANITIVAAK